MGLGRTALSTTLAISLAACGGGGGGGSAPPIGGTPTPTPTPTSTACAVSQQQQFAFDAINEWYLFPDLIATNVNRANFTTVQAYMDALTAPARAAGKDDFFNFATSIAEENALINSGSNAGFGIRLGYDTVNNRVFVLEAYETAPAFPAGIDRGTELLAIGTSSSNLQSVSSLMASGGPQAVSNALGPSTAGTTRVLQFRTAGGVTNERSITKADYSLDPVSDRYGALILNDGGKRVGYINLRTFIVSDASNQLRTAFANFRSQGVTEVILDLRYNSGGLVVVAETLGDLLGRTREGQVFSNTVWRASKASRNSTRNFLSEPNSIAPTKLAIIGTTSTASASELVSNSMLAYLRPNMALIGTNTSGKPVGQSAFDVAACDLRLRVVTFKTDNAAGQGEYFNGLADPNANPPFFTNTCRANDDVLKPLGDPTEASIATALDFLAGRSCTAISGGTQRTAQSVGAGRQLLQPEAPSAAQHQIPGLF
ncbi:peptidase S41 [Altererythrobacter sp. BO-6]|uniref:S41 family peptidase n=1 Tax=Altererythrobacter sp. BO-6 TaxID=2604537 RepID=UPI0013E1AF8D|nr:S41 family peptidase [Altererythrobacter sp. BO-6]QIG53695.1 peptidase S41 [Altererythrobacter sp. BO-6]